MTLAQFYNTLIDDPEQCCSFITGLSISQPTVWNIAHVLAKGQNKYPLYAMYKKNVVLLTEHEHTLFDHGTEEQRQKYAEECNEKGFRCDWQKLYNLRDELMLQYPDMR